MPGEVYTCTRQCAVPDSWDRIALENASEKVRHCPHSAGYHHDRAQPPKSLDGKDPIVEREKGKFIHAVRKGIEYDSEIEVLHIMDVSYTALQY